VSGRCQDPAWPRSARPVARVRPSREIMCPGPKSVNSDGRRSRCDLHTPGPAPRAPSARVQPEVMTTVAGGKAARLRADLCRRRPPSNGDRRRPGLAFKTSARHRRGSAHAQYAKLELPRISVSGLTLRSLPAKVGRAPQQPRESINRNLAGLRLDVVKALAAQGRHRRCTFSLQARAFGALHRQLA